MKKFILISMLILLPIQAQAVFYTGNKLVEDMQEYEKDIAHISGSKISSGHYMGFIAGTFDTLEGQMICGTSGVTQGQATAIVTQYLKLHPEKWSYGGADLVTAALMNAFPCKK